MGSSSSSGPKLVEVGKGFWNIRGSFKTFAGLIDVGTQMSIIRLSSGRFLVVDTIPLDPTLKTEIDTLTNNGKDIDAVIATHPFHTLAFPDFHTAYPHVPYYGTPRHLRNIKTIPWSGCISDPQVMTAWSPDVEMRIPEGAEWNAPQPEAHNHFNCCWVFSPSARTIHVDDTLNYIADPPFFAKLVGVHKDQLMFHPSMTGPGLHPTEEAPLQFKAWVEQLLLEWDFDNICCAHIENKIGGGHAALSQILADSESTFQKMSDKAKKEGKKVAKVEEIPDGENCSKYNVYGNECG